MPYIPSQRRDNVDLLQGPGDLTYILTSALESYRKTHGDSFQVIAEILGSLEASKLEFYRRIAAPYEDKRKAENGDVYSMAEPRKPSGPEIVCPNKDCAESLKERSEYEIRNYNPTWHDGDIHCIKCGTYIRGFDGG